MAKAETADYIKVTQVKSAIGRIEPQKRTIRALGLGKISSSSVLPDNPAVRGMVNSVAHLVRVEKAEAKEAPIKKVVKKPVAKDLPKTKPAKVEAKATITAEKPAAAKKPGTAAKKPATAAKKPAAKRRLLLSPPPPKLRRIKRRPSSEAA